MFLTGLWRFGGGLRNFAAVVCGISMLRLQRVNGNADGLLLSHYNGPVV